MASDQEKFEKEERARRLKAARQAAGFSGPKGVVSASNGEINENVYKGHESGRNGFTVSDGRVYARLFDVSLEWLFLGEGPLTPRDKIPATVSGEAEIKNLLRRIDKLPEAAIEPIWGLVTFYLPKDALQSERSLADGQSALPTLPRGE